ncbi:hypothetical protein BD779DRAFT_1186697 [Infundibulicybe gibba]|nr:hypothetical protein BD779DRAFT_1186697 [Infundibulicybe gibba]
MLRVHFGDRCFQRCLLPGVRYIFLYPQNGLSPLWCLSMLISSTILTWGNIGEPWYGHYERMSQLRFFILGEFGGFSSSSRKMTVIWLLPATRSDSDMKVTRVTYYTRLKSSGRGLGVNRLNPLI